VKNRENRNFHIVSIDTATWEERKTKIIDLFSMVIDFYMFLKIITATFII